MDETPRVLQNRGPQITLRDETGNGTSQHELRFTQADFCVIEEKYENLANWLQKCSDSPLRMQREVIGLVFGVDIDDRDAVKAFGSRMVAAPAEYNRAFGIAWAVANGVDPTVATESYDAVANVVQGATAEGMAPTLLAEAIKEATGQTNGNGSSRSSTRGPTGAKPGARRARASKRSGPSVPPKPSSPSSPSG